MATELVAAAFGPTATLYDVLQCDKRADPSQLKRAYRRQALKFHPDKAHARATAAKSSRDHVVNQKAQDSDESHRYVVSTETLQDGTLKFQAVSAAYSILMDPRQRKLYDTTGRVRDDDDNDDFEDIRRRQTSRTTDQQNWDDFFNAVFQEIVTAEEKHGRPDSYRGSEEEVQDVLRYYKMCKGNFPKMLDCIVHGDMQDTKRWKKDIIEPAIERGDIHRYDSGKVTTKCPRRERGEHATNVGGIVELVDTDDESRETKSFKRGKKRLRKANGAPKCSGIKVKTLKASTSFRRSNAAGTSDIEGSILIDTDDEEEGVATKIGVASAKAVAHGAHSSTNNEMSRRDKLEYRVAKKRKQQAERDMEVASLLKSKTWSGSRRDDRPSKHSAKQGERRMGPFSDALLSSMEKRYSAPPPQVAKTKRRRPNRSA